MTTTEDLAAIVREVGGDRVTVESISKGYQDPHFVEAKPSFILRLNKADLLVVVGRELEMAWLPPLITQSRNAKIQPGGPGYLDASQDVKILDIPTGQITRAMGDVHPQGNPHYWLDPAQRSPDRADDSGPVVAAGAGRRRVLRAARRGVRQEGERREKRWKAALAPYKGLKVVTYHRSWTNFADAFGLDVVGYVEPKPGIPPSPSHTLDLIHEIKRQNIKIILVEPYFDLQDAQRHLARHRRESAGHAAIGRRREGG